MSTLSETVLDQIEIKGKTIGILRLEERNPQKVLEELARMNARPATREEALEYRKERAGTVGSEACTQKFEDDPEGKTNEPIVFALREDWYVLGYLSDVGEDIPEIEYQGVVAVTEE